MADPTVTTAHLVTATASLGYAPASWPLEPDGVESLRRAGGPALGAGARVPFSDDARDALQTARLVASGLERKQIGAAHLWFAALRVPGPAREVQRRLAPDSVVQPDLPRGYVLQLLEASAAAGAYPKRCIEQRAERGFDASPEQLWHLAYEPGLVEFDDVVSVTVEEGPRGLGEVRRIVHASASAQYETRQHVVGFEPDRSLTFVEEVRGFTTRTTAEIAPTGSGTTLRLHAVVEVDQVRGLLAEAQQGDLATLIRDGLERVLDLFTAHLRGTTE